jgi:hypothetical protein
MLVGKPKSTVEPMIQVTYVSRTREPMSSEQLLDLLCQCRANNRESGVTGMLIYGNGTFLQALEGEEPLVDELVAHILEDPRHADIEVLSRRPIERREYADWSMGFDLVDDDGLREVEGLRDFGAAHFNFDHLASNGPVVQRLLEHYREPHFDQVMSELDAKDRVIEHLRGALKELRDRSQVARLALAAVVSASHDGVPSERLIHLCECALEGLRPTE